MMIILISFKSGGQFPKSQFSVVNIKTFPLRNMTIDEVGPNIAAFCKGFGLVLAADFVKDNIEAELGILVRGMLPLKGYVLSFQ